MSKEEKQVKRSVNYERNVPRCGNCIHIHVHQKKGGIGIVTLCKEINCQVARNSVCDLWESKKGETV